MINVSLNHSDRNLKSIIPAGDREIREKYSEIPTLGKRTLGRGEARMVVSELGFGAMGLTFHRGVPKDPEEMKALLNQAADYGIDFFDTAEIYGPFTNEELVGQALGKRQDVAIATKFGHRIADNGQPVYGALDSTPQRIRRVCEESLRRLKRDHIDLFYQHRVDPMVPIEEVADTVKTLIKEGKVLHFGLCEANEENIRRAHNVQPVTAVQSEYHLMWRLPESYFGALEELGIGLVPYSPLNRGFLGGLIDENTTFSSFNDNRSTLPRFTKSALKKNYPIVETIGNFGKIYGAAVAQVELAWLLKQKPWIVPILGTTKLDHLLENLKSVEFHIPEEDWKRLEKQLESLPIEGDRYGDVEKQQTFS